MTPCRFEKTRFDDCTPKHVIDVVPENTFFSFLDGLLYFVGGRVYLEAMTKKGSDAYRTHRLHVWHKGVFHNG